MLFNRERELQALRITTSTLTQRIQQLSEELAKLRAHIPKPDDPNLAAQLAAHLNRAHATVNRQLDRLLEGIRSGAEVAALLTRLGRAGSLARARTAWRYLDGTFMPESVRLDAYREEYERHAAGGGARANFAVRNRDGTFRPKS